MYTYYAFISYSHKDTRFAKKFQEKLEFYNLNPLLKEIDNKKIRCDKEIRKMLQSKTNSNSVVISGKISILSLLKQKIMKALTSGKSKLYPICRDSVDFSSGSSLGHIIDSHLDLSKKLIVLCSNNSLSGLKSDNSNTDYIKREIKHFVEKDNGSFDNIIFVNVYKKGDIIPLVGNMLVSVIKDLYEENKKSGNMSASNKTYLKEYGEIIKRFKQASEETEDIYKVNYDDVLGNKMPKIAGEPKKDVCLEVISNMLGVDYGFVKKRDKCRKKKRAARMSLITLLVCGLLSWFFTKLTVDSWIEKAKNIKNDNLSKSIELLLKAEQWTRFPSKNFSWLDDAEVTEALNDVMNYNAGTLLRKITVVDDYILRGRVLKGYRYAELETNSMGYGYGQKLLIDLTTGEKVANYDISDGELIVKNTPLKGRFKTESGTYGNIIGVKDNIYILESGVDVQPGTTKLWSINVSNGTVKSISVKQEWESNYIQTFNGVYYVEENCLHFCDYDGNDEIVRNSVGIFFADEDGIYTSDTEYIFKEVTDRRRIESLPNHEFLKIIDKDNNDYIFDKKTSELLDVNVPKFSDYIDISQDRRFIAYGDKNKITVEDFNKNRSFTIDFDKAAVVCAFRPDSKALWIVNTRGELRTYALEPSIFGTSFDGDVIFDVNDANICWLSDEKGTYKYDLINNVKYKIIDKNINFVSQTDKEIIFTVDMPKSRAPLTKCFDKHTGKICETNLDIIKEPSSDFSNEEKMIYDSIKNYIKSHFHNIELECDYHQISRDGKYWAMYGRLFENNMPKFVFCIYDVKTKKEIFNFRYMNNKKYPYVEKNKQQEYKPIFDETGNYFLVSYESADDLRIKTMLYEMQGRLIGEFEGDAICAKGMSKYWKENIFLKGNTNKYINVLGNDTIYRAKAVLDFCKNVHTVTQGDLVISTDEEAVKYNANGDFYKIANIKAIPEIRIIYNDGAGNENDVTDSLLIEMSDSVFYSIYINDPNGVYETVLWYDNEPFKNSTYGLNKIPIRVPLLYRDGEEHILHISVTSNIDKVVDQDINFIFKE